MIAEVYRLLVVNTPELGGGSGVTVGSAGQLERSTREDGTYWFALGAGPVPSCSSTQSCARGWGSRSQPSATARRAPRASG